ncbi:MAG: energy transducer TonB, partial [Bacteroidales bacterium]|nr:energy transducer TonB [Candidatus Sodaliphilus fimicaballi]
MERGKETCRALKDLRQRIADANGIAYTPTECHHKGDCAGTCPACEAEVQYIEQQLSLRRMLGKAVVVAGLSLGVASCTNATAQAQNACDTVAAQQTSNDEAIKGEVAQSNEGLLYDTVPPVEGEIRAPECDYDKDAILKIAENMPVFPGGDEALYKFITEHLVYPEQAVKDSIEGRVVVQFVVKKDGSVDDIRIARSVHSLLDVEAVRVAKTLPKFIPASHKGKTVNVWYLLPVKFKLPDEKKK